MKQSSKIYVFKRRLRRYLPKRAFYNVCDVQHNTILQPCSVWLKLMLQYLIFVLTVNHTLNYVTLSTTELSRLVHNTVYTSCTEINVF